jgi:hypothetical protein
MWLRLATTALKLIHAFGVKQIPNVWQVNLPIDSTECVRSPTIDSFSNI